MLGFCPLGSGSKGNCIYLGTPKVKILIDAGMSAKSIKLRLAAINVDIADIDAILISHEHTDHIQALQVLSCKLGIPVLANRETAKGIAHILPKCPKFKIFTTGETFEFGDLSIHPFSIQHDTLDPVAFIIRVDGLKLGFCTDLGFVTNLVRNHLQECDYLYIESNHEISMVHASARPLVYKQRVLSRSGHLSNEACGHLLAAVFHTKLKHVHLAHLSSECNTHATALGVVSSILAAHGMQVDTCVAPQDNLGRSIYF